MKTYTATFLKTLGVIIFLFLGVNSTFAQKNSVSAGDWNDPNKWSPVGVPSSTDIVNINHAINLNSNWGPTGAGYVTINTNTGGGGTLNMDGGTLDIKANVTLTGSGFNLNGGTIIVRSGYTLTLPGTNEAKTHYVVESGATLIINGDLLNNHGQINVDGLITVNGNYTGQASDADVFGTGNITSTGSMTGINTSSIFGTENPSCPSNCDGRNLFGGQNCTGTASATPSVSTVCVGESVSFTSALAGGYGNTGYPKLYQWQIKNNSNVYVNISGATDSTYNVSPLVTSSYRVVIGEKQNSGAAYCYKFSTPKTITVNPCPNIWTGTTSIAWNVATNWSLGVIPTSVMNVSIPATVSSGNMPTVSATSSAGNLTNQGTITFTGTGILNVSGNISNTGTITTVLGSTIGIVGSTPQTISGVPGVYNLKINNTNGSGVSLSSAMLVNGTISLINGVFTTNNNLTINFDAGGNIAYNLSDAGSISGQISGRRNLVAKTHYISAPFVGVTSGQISASTPIYNPSGIWLLSSKNFNGQGWDLVKDYTTSIEPGTGYALAMFNPASLTMTGTYTHGATYNSGDYDNTIPDGNTRGMYFMMGNPYPGTLDWDNVPGWTKTNINNAIYFWNPVTSSVASYVGGNGTNGGTQYIPAMQSFLVKIPGGGGFSSLSVNSNARVLTNASYFRTSPNQIVRLVVKNAVGTSSDETVVCMDDEFTSDFDSDADAFKIGGALSLYTKTTDGEIDYSINTLPITGAEMTIPLNLKVAVNGLYTIECKEYSIPGYSMILEDKQTKTYTPMDDATVYTINASRTDSTNRFVLRFRAGITTGVATGSSSDLQISTYDNQMMLNVSGAIQSNNATINVYSASGLQVKTFNNHSISSGIQTVALPGLSPGVYITKIEIDGTTYVGKVVLK